MMGRREEQKELFSCQVDLDRRVTNAVNRSTFLEWQMYGLRLP